jgi:predicted dehydrogenase
MELMLRIGIVGCGLIGQKRAKAAIAEGHTVSIVADLDRKRAESLAALAGKPRVAASWQEVTASDVDAVVVATTHDMLAPISLAAIEAGKHVLVEKPAARTAAEVAPVVAAARKRGVIVKVGFNHRFHPAMLKARQLVDEGAIGPLLYIRGRYGHGGRVGYEKEWRCMPQVSGGGELIDQGSHLIDLSRWFLGDFAEVTGFAPTYFWSIPVDDNCFLALRTAAGQMAWLHASWTEWKNLFSFEIFGQTGKLQIDGLGGSYGVERLTLFRMAPEMGPPETTSWEFPFPDTSWELECRDFFAAIAEKRRPTGDIEDAKANLDIIGKVYESTAKRA